MAKQSKREQIGRAKAQEPTGGGKPVRSANARDSTSGSKQVGSAKAQERTGGAKQIERAKARDPTNRGKQVERGKAHEPTRGHRKRGKAHTPTPESLELAKAHESTREYKQVERARAQERTREALIAAATDEFFEGNWLKTSLDSLSRKAGVTRQTLLRHFGSKDGLLMQSLMRGAAQLRDQRWNTPTADISGAVDNVLDHYEEWGERSVRIGAWQRGPTVLALFSNAARQIHYEWVEHAFAQWLEKLDEETRARRRAALIVLCDVQTWWILCNDLGLARKEVHAILTEQIEYTLGEK